MLIDENSALRMQIKILTDVNAALVEQRDAANLQVGELQKELAALRHTGQHMTCGQCEQLRETQMCARLGCGWNKKTHINQPAKTCGDFIEKPKSEHVLACSSCGADDEPAHREGCVFLEKRIEEPPKTHILTAGPCICHDPHGPWGTHRKSCPVHD